MSTALRFGVANFAARVGMIAPCGYRLDASAAAGGSGSRVRRVRLGGQFYSTDIDKIRQLKLVGSPISRATGDEPSRPSGENP